MREWVVAAVRRDAAGESAMAEEGGFVGRQQWRQSGLSLLGAWSSALSPSSMLHIKPQFSYDSHTTQLTPGPARRRVA